MDSSLLTGLLVGLIVGLVIGAAVILMFQRRQTGNKTVLELQQEHTEFREQVADHFVETAGLVNRLTDSYKEVFDHLQSGAQTLVDPQTLQDKLPNHGGETVTLRRIGARQSSQPVAAENPGQDE